MMVLKIILPGLSVVQKMTRAPHRVNCHNSQPGNKLTEDGSRDMVSAKRIVRRTKERRTKLWTTTRLYKVAAGTCLCRLCDVLTPSFFFLPEFPIKRSLATTSITSSRTSSTMCCVCPRKIVFPRNPLVKIAKDLLERARLLSVRRCDPPFLQQHQGHCSSSSAHLSPIAHFISFLSPLSLPLQGFAAL